MDVHVDVDRCFVQELPSLRNFAVFLRVAIHALRAPSRDVFDFGNVVAVLNNFAAENAINSNILNVQHNTKNHRRKRGFVVNLYNDFAGINLNLGRCIKDVNLFSRCHIPCRGGGGCCCANLSGRRCRCRCRCCFHRNSAAKVNHCFLRFCPFRPSLHSQNVIVSDFERFVDVHVDVHRCFVHELPSLRNFIVFLRVAVHALRAPSRDVNNFRKIVTVLHNFATEDAIARNLWDGQFNAKNHRCKRGFVVHAHHNLGCIDRNARRCVKDDNLFSLLHIPRHRCCGCCGRGRGRGRGRHRCCGCCR